MQSPRSLTTATLVQAASGLAAVALVIALLGGEFRSPDPVLLSPNAFLAYELILVALFIWATRRRAKVSEQTVRDQVSELGELPEHSPVRFGLLTLRPRGSNVPGAALRMPLGGVWADGHLISASMFDHDEYPLKQWGIQSFDSVSALQRATPEGNIVAILARLHPRTVGDDHVDGASMSDAATPVAVWVRPGTPADSRVRKWADEQGIQVVDDVASLATDLGEVSSDPAPQTRLPRRRFFVTTYWRASATPEQYRARLSALLGVSAAVVIALAAASLMIAWVLGGASIASPVQVGLLASGGGLGLVTAAVLYPIARRLDNRYERALLS